MTCCFIGHRQTPETEELTKQVYEIAEDLILTKDVDTFFFGSKSRFNSLCYEQITKLKARYPHIQRVYIRAEFPYIDESYERFLLERYEKTYYSSGAIGAGRAVYVKRNQQMIDQSDFCVFYLQKSALPGGRKSGTLLAWEYGVKKNKTVIVLP